MRILCVLILLMFSSSSATVLAVTTSSKDRKKDITPWAYDSVRERAESQIRIRRLQHMMEHYGSIEAEQNLLEAIKLDNAQR